jgi:hypothetical protein
LFIPLAKSQNLNIYFLNGHFKICRLGAVEEIPQKNILFPEFLRLFPPEGGQAGKFQGALIFWFLFYQEKRNPPEAELISRHRCRDINSAFPG